jgi:AcrR family transcriptional regulator
MARPKKAEQRDTRQAILDAALDLFAEHGFFGTSMREIARTVGVRESALYHHFESKQAIFQEMLKTLGPGRVSLVMGLDVEGLARALGAKAMTKRMLDTIIAAWTAPEEQKIFRVIFQEGFRLAAADVISPPLVLGRIRGALTNVFERLMAIGEIRKVDAGTAAVSFMGPLMMLRIIHMSGPKPDIKAMQTEIDRLHEQLWESLKPLEAQKEPRRAS